MNELLDFQAVTIRRDNKTICENLSFKVYPRDFCGILGVNGRGKTTLLHTIAGLIKPTCGNIFIAEKNLLHLSRKQVAQRIGLLLQNENFTFPTTVHDTIRCGNYARSQNNEDDKLLKEILHELNLVDYEKRNLLHLSGGEQRRVSIGRILFQKPEFLYLLDEPNNHLDPVYQQRVMMHFKKICEEQSAAVLITGHDFSLMKQYCNRFLLLFEEGGAVVAENSMIHDQLLQQVYSCDNLYTLINE